MSPVLIVTQSPLSYHILTVYCRPSYPLHIAIAGDLGQTINTSTTLSHIVAHKPDILINTGDLSYADCYGPDDPNAGFSSNGYVGPDDGKFHYRGTNQQRWDT